MYSRSGRLVEFNCARSSTFHPIKHLTSGTTETVAFNGEENKAFPEDIDEEALKDTSLILLFCNLVDIQSVKNRGKRRLNSS